jgi:hypothetical protein
MATMVSECAWMLWCIYIHRLSCYIIKIRNCAHMKLIYKLIMYDKVETAVFCHVPVCSLENVQEHLQCYCCFRWKQYIFSPQSCSSRILVTIYNFTTESCQVHSHVSCFKQTSVSERDSTSTPIWSQKRNRGDSVVEVSLHDEGKDSVLFVFWFYMFWCTDSNEESMMLTQL